MDQQQLIYELVQIKRPNECMIIGEQTVQMIISDCLESYDDFLFENYKDPEYGHNFELIESVALIVSSIQTFAILYSLIKNIKKYNLEKQQLQTLVKDALVDNGIDEQTAEIYCEYFVENLKKQKEEE